MKPKVAVVILNWNGKTFLEKFLPSIMHFNSNISKVFLADNASTDDSVMFVRTKYPEIDVVLNSKNTGFAQGYNDALKKIDAEYYVLLNSDVEVTENWIDPMISEMDKDRSIAACQPKIKSYQNKKYFEHAGAAGGFIDKWGFPFCRGRIFDFIEEDVNQYEESVELFWATGACMFVRSDLFHACGAFDGDFFAHMEEIDLCWRFKKMGYKIMFFNHTSVYHVGGGTLQYISPMKTYLNFRNSLYLLFKNLPFFQLVPVLFIRLILDGIAGVKFLTERKFHYFFAVLKAHFRFYFELPALIRKRRQIITGNSVSCVYKHSIVFDYFIRGKKKYSDLTNVE